MHRKGNISSNILCVIRCLWPCVCVCEDMPVCLHFQNSSEREVWERAGSPVSVCPKTAESVGEQQRLSADVLRQQGAWETAKVSCSCESEAQAVAELELVVRHERGWMQT